MKGGHVTIEQLGNRIRQLCRTAGTINLSYDCGWYATGKPGTAYGEGRYSVSIHDDERHLQATAPSCAALEATVAEWVRANTA